MINDDILIKFARHNGVINWPRLVRTMKQRLIECKLGFPGIGNNHLTLISKCDLKEGDIFIYDTSIVNDIRDDNSPLMLRCLPNSQLYIEGIGTGLDSKDLTRSLYKWKDVIEIELQNVPILRVDVRPTINGGPGYYYFFKSYRDLRL